MSKNLLWYYAYTRNGHEPGPTYSRNPPIIGTKDWTDLDGNTVQRSDR